MDTELENSSNTTYTMRQASKALGITSQRLRRYCRKGLVSGVRHPHMGQGYNFTREQMDALRLAHFLTLAGCSVKDIRKYNSLAYESDASSTDERRAILHTHKRQVWQQIEDLQQTIDFLERLEESLN